MNTYTNTKGNRIFISKDNWFVTANRTWGPAKSDVYYIGQLFENGKLVDAEYEISQRKLNRYFVKVGA